MQRKHPREAAVSEHIVIRSALAQRFAAAMEQGRIVFFSAPCGFGKTTTAHALLRGRRVCRGETGKIGLSVFKGPEAWEVLLVDDFQQLREDEAQVLCDLIRTHPDRRFVLLSRGVVPGWLEPFRFTGLMLVLEANDLLFDRETTAKALAAFGVHPTGTELNAIQRDTMGYPLAVGLLGREMKGGARYASAVNSRVRRELYAYYEELVYRRFSLGMRRFLLELAPFERLNTELARTVSGDSRVGELMAELQRSTTMLQYRSVDDFSFWPDFRAFLLWEMEREYSEEERCRLYNRGGLYYELHGDYAQALTYYDRGGDSQRVSDLLEKNAQLHPGMGYYEEMERYYRALPEETVLSSPAMMQSMSVLCALHMDYEGSQRWYQALKAFGSGKPGADAATKEARARLSWLDISLPQRGVSGLTRAFTKAIRMVQSQGLGFPSFSATSSLPSLLNGAKDLSEWSRRDDAVYDAVRRPMETVFGKDAVGLADCALAESKFEKGEDIYLRMLALVARLGEIQHSGTPDIEFVVVGLLARSMIDAGDLQEAEQAVLGLRRRFAEADESRFLPNIDAMLCRFAICRGDEDAVAEWYHEKAPRDLLNLHVMWRYRYQTQAMAEITLGKYAAAQMTLAPLERYCQVCDRHIDAIHMNLLRAIAMFRAKNADFSVPLRLALEEAARYHFIRTVSQYGAAVLPLLGQCGWDADKEFLEAVTTAARVQAANYPDFMALRQPHTEPLTASELQVLKLVCAGRSNAEIGELLHIKLATVKTHVSHILQKLDVKRRSEAKDVAERLRLV